MSSFPTFDRMQDACRLWACMNALGCCCIFIIKSISCAYRGGGPNYWVMAAAVVLYLLLRYVLKVI